jgi:hypothetical protein
MVVAGIRTISIGYGNYYLVMRRGHSILNHISMLSIEPIKWVKTKVFVSIIYRLLPKKYAKCMQ